MAGGARNLGQVRSNDCQHWHLYAPAVDVTFEKPALLDPKSPHPGYVTRSNRVVAPRMCACSQYDFGFRVSLVGFFADPGGYGCGFTVDPCSPPSVWGC